LVILPEVSTRKVPLPTLPTDELTLEGAELLTLEGVELLTLEGTELEMLDGVELLILEGTELLTLDGAEEETEEGVELLILLDDEELGGVSVQTAPVTTGFSAGRPLLLLPCTPNSTD